MGSLCPPELLVACLSPGLSEQPWGSCVAAGGLLRGRAVRWGWLGLELAGSREEPPCRPTEKALESQWPREHPGATLPSAPVGAQGATLPDRSRGQGRRVTSHGWGAEAEARPVHKSCRDTTPTSQGLNITALGEDGVQKGPHRRLCRHMGRSGRSPSRPCSRRNHSLEPAVRERVRPARRACPKDLP